MQIVYADDSAKIICDNTGMNGLMSKKTEEKTFTYITPEYFRPITSTYL